MKYKVEGTDEGGHVADVIPLQVVQMARGELGSPREIAAEIDDMADAIRDFWQMEPDQVMRACSAYTARCSELYIKLHRIEGRERAYKQIRTQHVNTLLDELDRQHKIASRMLEVRRQDLEQQKGY